MDVALVDIGPRQMMTACLFLGGITSAVSRLYPDLSKPACGFLDMSLNMYKSVLGDLVDDMQRGESEK